MSSEDDGYVDPASGEQQPQQQQDDDLPSDGNLIMATLAATLLLVAAINCAYYYSSRLREIRTFDILLSRSKEITDSFEMTDTSELCGPGGSGDGGGFSVQARGGKRRQPSRTASRALDDAGGGSADRSGNGLYVSPAATDDEEDAAAPSSGAERRRDGIGRSADSALLEPPEDSTEAGAFV